MFSFPIVPGWVETSACPLSDQLSEIQAEDLVVLELSSFQLELMTISPAVASILNITPNHLDRHGTMEAYTAAKAHIINYQTSRDTAVLNREDSGSWGLVNTLRGKTGQLWHGRAHIWTTPARITRMEICACMTGNPVRLSCRPPSIQLRGQHNLLNALAACAIAHSRRAGHSFHVGRSNRV